MKADENLTEEERKLKKEEELTGGNKIMKNDKILRYDRIDAPNWMIEAFRKNDEGFLVGRANITNVGIFTYRNEDGSERKELRLPEEVFSRASLDSLKMKPVTNDHPHEFVKSDNIGNYQVGTLGSNPSTPTAWSGGEPGLYSSDGVGDYPNGRLPDTDRFHLSCDMVISQEQAIMNVEDGKMELSAGYEVELEEVSGIWMGMKYDAIQRNIRYNHVAIVDNARAGDAARIILRQDSADAICIGQCEMPKKFKEDSMDANLKKIRIDSVEREAEAEVIIKLDSESKRADSEKDRADTAEKDLAALKVSVSKTDAEMDNLKAENKKLTDEAEAKKDSAIDPKVIGAAVKARKVVEDAAEKAGIEVKEDMADVEIKKAVVLSVYKTDDAEMEKLLSEKLDSDQVYLEGRFDGAVDSLSKRTDTSDKNSKKQSEIPNKDSFKTDEAKIKEAQDTAEESVRSAWERKE